MLTQRLYRTGNAVVVTIPKASLKQLDLKEGSQVIVETDADAQTITILVNKDKKPKSTVTPRFLKWMESFNNQYGPALQELAKK